MGAIMASAATTDIWAILWPVIIGGLLATLPGVVGQIVTHVLAQSAAAKTRRRNRFQRIADGLAELERWLSGQKNELVYGEKPKDDPDPLPAVMTMAMMDFPELLPELDELEDKARLYTQWQQKAAVKRLQGNLTELNSGFDEAFKPYWQQHLVVVAKLRSIATTKALR